MLVLTLGKKDRVDLGDDHLQLLDVYNNCIWIAYNTVPIKIPKFEVTQLGDSTIKFISNRRGRAMIGLTCPKRIERVATNSLTYKNNS